MNSFTRAMAYRIVCERALFLEIDQLAQRDDVSIRFTTQLNATTEERAVVLEAYGDGLKQLVELLRRFGAKEAAR